MAEFVFDLFLCESILGLANSLFPYFEFVSIGYQRFLVVSLLQRKPFCYAVCSGTLVILLLYFFLF